MFPATRAARPDSRLFWADPLLVGVTCLAFGAAACVAPAPTLLAGLLGLLGVRAQLTRWQRALGVLALLVGWGRGSHVLHGFTLEQARVRAWLGAPARCAMLGEVTSSPSLRGGSLRFDAELRELDCEGQISRELTRVRLYAPPGPLARGDEFTAVGDLGQVSTFRNFDLPDPRPLGARQGSVLSGAVHSLEVVRASWSPAALIDGARGHVRARIEATFSESVKGMARALVLGESDLSPTDDQAFRKSGLSHLLAVSGTHLIFAVLALVRGFEALLRRCERLAARCDVRRPAAVMGCVLAPLYADFAGSSGSAWRAAWMLCAVLGVRALGRHVFASRVLAASLGLGWLVDALVVFDPSFLLSIAATVGLMALGQRLDAGLLTSPAELVKPRAPDLARVTHLITRAALTTLAATLPCVPIILLMAPGISLASVGANLLAAPLGEAVALPLCLTHALLSPLPALERGTALVASGALSIIRGLAHASASVDWLYVELPPPHAWHLAAAAAGAAGCLGQLTRPWGRPIQRGVGRHALSCALVTALSIALIEGATRWQHSAARGRQLGRLRVTALDVGQGDATLVDLPDGRLMLIDGGGFVGSPVDPGERVILPTLRARRRAHIDILVLSHPHPDHMGGLLAVAEAVSIGEYWYRGDEPPASASEATAATGGSRHAALLATLRRRGVRTRDARELCRTAAGGLAPADAPYRLSVLSPCPEPDPTQSLNDNSLVVRAQVGRHAALFLGDAERWAERRLLQREPDELRVELLKVGHHGSGSSTTPALIARAQPRFASISCGVRNRFGHPHPETLATLARANVRVLRVDLEGAVMWQSDGARQSAVSFSSSRPLASAPGPSPLADD